MPENLIVLLEDIFSSPEVISAIALFAAGLIGRANLERVPFFGVFVKILAALVDAVNDALVASQIAKQAQANEAYAQSLQAASQAASMLVEGQEQMKSIGKVDGPTAAALVTAQVARDFDLEQDVAKLLTERAVRALHLP
jgi:hypothetical protein